MALIRYGSMEQFPVESYQEMKRVAFGLATSSMLPDEYLASSSGGRGAVGTANVSDGQLAGPSTAPTSYPEEEHPLAISSPRAGPSRLSEPTRRAPRDRVPFSSASRGSSSSVSYGPPLVDPSGGRLGVDSLAIGQGVPSESSKMRKREIA